jgi:hypothetical protein
MTALLERHGQGGVGDADNDIAYWSSFLVADPRAAWVLETSGRRWAARPVAGGDAISNRLTLRRDWTRAAPGVAPGTDIESWRDQSTPTGFADGRLGAGRAFVAGRSAAAMPCDPRAAVAHLRDHGTGPWGAPGEEGPVVAPPDDVLPDGTGVTVCMHVRDFEATTASMVASLSADGPGRAWVAVGNPCASVFVPVLLPAAGDGATPAVVPAVFAQPAWVRRWAAVSRAVESGGDVPAAVRAVLGPVEARLWDESDTLGSDTARWRAFVARAGVSVSGALDELAGAGIGVLL